METNRPRLDAIHAIVQRANGSGQFKAALAMQKAPIRASAGAAWSQIDATFVGPNAPFARNTTVITIDTSDAAAFRLGVFYGLDSGSTGAEAEVAIEAAYGALGEVVSTLTLDITMEAANVWHCFGIVDFRPTLHTKKLKYVYVVTSVEGTGVVSRPVFRTADTAVESAGAWRTSSTDWSPTYADNSGAGEFNSDELAINVNPSHFFVQPGIAAKFTSGTSARLSIAVLVQAVEG